MATARITPVAIKRAIVADGWLPKVTDRAETELRRQADDVCQAVSDGARGVPADLVTRWRDRLSAVKAPLVVAMATDGHALGRIELGHGSKSLDRRWAVALRGKDGLVIPPASDVLPDGTIVWPDEDMPLVARRLRANVGSYVEATSKLESGTSARRYGRLLEQAARERWTLQQTISAITELGLASSPVRAELMARTTTIWAYNEGAVGAYLDEGIATGQWVATPDDAECEFCAGLHGVELPLGRAYLAAGQTLVGTTIVDDFEHLTGPRLSVPFDITHPPLHPRCRCTIVPVV